MEKKRKESQALRLHQMAKEYGHLPSDLLKLSTFDYAMTNWVFEVGTEIEIKLQEEANEKVRKDAERKTRR